MLVWEGEEPLEAADQSDVLEAGLDPAAHGPHTRGRFHLRVLTHARLRRTSPCTTVGDVPTGRLVRRADEVKGGTRKSLEAGAYSHGHFGASTAAHSTGVRSTACSPSPRR